MITGKTIIWVVLLVAVLIALRMIIGFRANAASHQATAALGHDKEYLALTDEYRRLSELAVTAQEHTDLRLTELTTQVGYLRSQLEQVQNILKDVE